MKTENVTQRTNNLGESTGMATTDTKLAQEIYGKSVSTQAPLTVTTPALPTHQLSETNHQISYPNFTLNLKIMENCHLFYSTTSYLYYYYSTMSSKV